MVTTCNGGGWIVVDNDDDNQEPQTNIKPKDKPIDRNHPHQCFRCKKPLKFQELLDRNLKYYWWCDPEGKLNSIKIFNNEAFKKYKHLKKLWKNKYVQFYCCRCYSMLFISLNKWL